MTYEGLALTDVQILKVMSVAMSAGGLVMVLAENHDIIRYITDMLEALDRIAPRLHATSRPALAEREATDCALALAELMDVPVVIVHVPRGEAIEEMNRALARGLKMIVVAHPQYLVLTARNLEGLHMKRAKYVFGPLQRDKASHVGCWIGLQDGTFQPFSSDHPAFRHDDE